MKQSRLEQLRNLEVDASPDVWFNISNALPQERNRKFIFWIFSVAILIVAGIYILNSAHEKTNLSQKSEPVKSQFKKSVAIKQKSISNTDVDQSHIMQNETKSSFKTTENGGRNKIVNNSNPDNHTVRSASIGLPVKSNKATAISSENKMHVKSLSEYTTVNLSAEVTSISIRQYLIPDIKEDEIVKRDFVIPSENKLSRWSLYAGFGATFSNYHPAPDSIDESTSSIHSINNISFNLGARYDLSVHLRLSVGISNLILSQERTGMNAIPLNGTPGDPSNTYNIITPLGTISGLASDFDQTYFQSDSVLYPVVFSAIPFPPDAKSLEFTLREEFTYINIPVSVSYKWNRKFFTASAGLIFSTNLLTGYNLYLDGRPLAFQYHEKVSKSTFSGGAVGGFDFHLSKAFDLFLNGHFERNFNSIIGEKDFFNPIVWRLNSGFCYRFNR